jgi:beta-lactamase regulating signal transducer with metallopeptidase domain
MMASEILLDVAWKSAITLGVTLILLHLLRQRSAAQRAWVAHIGLVATLLLPLAVTLLPRWEVAAAAPVAQIAQPVAEFLEAPAAVDVPALVEDALPAVVVATPAVVADTSWLSTLLSGLTEPATLAALSYGVPAFLLLLVMLVAVGRLFALRARALVMVEQSWLTALAHAQRRMNFKHGTALLVSNEIRSPVSWGVLRPVILLNEEALTKNNDAEAIIAHELAHVARLDWASLLLARIATALFWFNPLVWLVARQAHQLREEAADDAVLRSNVNHLDYAALLVGAARHESHGFLLAANGVAPSRGSLKQRITRVLDQGQLRAPAYLSWMGICILGAAALALPLAAFSATVTPQAVAAPVAPPATPAPPPARLAQLPPAPPVPPAPRAAPEPPLPSDEWTQLRERAQQLAARERERLLAMVEREREKAREMIDRERERAEDQAERDRDQAEHVQERAEHAAKLETRAVARQARETVRRSVTVDVPGAFIQADPNGNAVIRAPGVHIEATSKGAVIQAPGVNIQAGAAGQRSGENAGATAGSMRMAQAGQSAGAAAGKPRAEDLIQMSVLGIDQDYRDEIGNAGYSGLSVNQLHQFKIHNVKGAWLRDLAELGYPNLSHKQITNMAIHNVSANFVRQAIKATSARPTPEQLVEMRILGIRPDRR